MVDGDGLLRISKCLLLVLLLQHSIRMEEAVTAVMMAVQTIIRLDGGSRGSGDDGCLEPKFLQHTETVWR